MVTIELTDEQVVNLVRQLPPVQKRQVLLALAADGQARREHRMQFAEGQLRRLSAERCKEWDAMTEEEREGFIDDLIHEDRSCPKPATAPSMPT